MELSTSAPLLISPSCPVPTVFAGRLPQPTRLPPPDGHAAFTALQVLFGRPTPRRASLPTSLSLIGSVAAAPPADPPRSPRVTHWSSIPCRPANTLVRWVDEIAFASVVQARPCPTFGRPVRHGVAPSTTARYCSANPSDPTSRWAPCPPQFRRGGSRSTLAVSSFRLRARLGISIPATCCRRGITPAFGYGPPHPGAGGTSTPPDQCAAWRTLHAHPPPSRLRLTSRCYQFIEPTLLPRFRAGARRASPVAQPVLVIVLSLPPRRSGSAVSIRVRPPMLPSPSGCRLGLRNTLSRPPPRSLHVTAR